MTQGHPQPLWIVRERVQAWLSLVLQCVSALRVWAFAVGLRQQHKAPRPVVSIGNVSFGGTGKTPTVIALVTALKARGLRVCILSRGYRRKKSQPTERVDPNGDATRFGDEPLLIARATGVPVVVDARRARAAQWAQDALQPDILLLDDGFSHLQLARDFDLVLLAANDMRFVARRRELRSALKRAHVLATLEPAIAAPPPGLVYIERTIADDARGLIAGKRVIAMAAIAHPERFERLLSDAGATVVERAYFHDHHAFAPGALEAALAKCKAGAADLVAITEKDAVKLASVPAGVVVVKMTVALPGPLVDRIAALVPTAKG